MKRLLVYFMSALLLAGCGSYDHSLQVDDNAYLLITANHFGKKSLIVDDGQEVNLYSDVKSFELDGKRAVKVKVHSGRHNVKIVDDGVISVDRDFYVSTGTSFELEL